MASTSKIILARQNLSGLSTNRSFVIQWMGLFVNGFDQGSNFRILGKEICVPVDGTSPLPQTTDELGHFFGS